MTTTTAKGSTMTTTTSPQYRRTQSGAWVVFGPAAQVRVGTVVVHRKDGSTKTEKIESVGKIFSVDGVPCAYGYIAGATQVRRSGNYRCDECDEWHATNDGSVCWETGLRH